MRLSLFISTVLLALSATADEGFMQVISVKGQGYYPDRMTAQGVCAANGYAGAVGFTQWRQAGDKIQGLRSYDGSAYFQSATWRGGMALDTVNCSQNPRPSNVSVKGQGYYPDRLTAHGVCIANGFYQAVGFTQWRQAGDKIEGLRSFDGSAFFQSHIWRGGMALDIVNCN